MTAKKLGDVNENLLYLNNLFTKGWFICVKL